MNKVNLLPIKRSLASAAAGATMFAFTAVPLLASNFSIEFFSARPGVMDLSIESIDERTGDFSGEAVAVNSNSLWEVVGTVAGNKVELELNNLKHGARIVATGEIQNDGTIEGKAATDEGELLEWEATDALVSKT